MTSQTWNNVNAPNCKINKINKKQKAAWPREHSTFKSKIGDLCRLGGERRGAGTLFQAKWTVGVEEAMLLPTLSWEKRFLGRR